MCKLIQSNHKFFNQIPCLKHSEMQKPREMIIQVDLENLFISTSTKKQGASDAQK